MESRDLELCHGLGLGDQPAMSAESIVGFYKVCQLESVPLTTTSCCHLKTVTLTEYGGDGYPDGQNLGHSDGGIVRPW